MVQEMTMFRGVLPLLAVMTGAIVHVSSRGIEIKPENYVKKQCPSYNTWKDKDRNCDLSQKGDGYHCTETMLQGDIKLVEYCSKPITIPAGHYPFTERRGDDEFFLVPKPCPDNRYSDRDRPTNSNTVGFFECSHEKVKCDQRGQQVCSNGDTTTDRTCKCDYKNHYALRYSHLHTVTNRICCSFDGLPGGCYCTLIEDKYCNRTTHELAENYVCIEKCKNGEIRKQESPTYPCVPGREVSTPSPSPGTSDPQTTHTNPLSPSEKTSEERSEDGKNIGLTAGSIFLAIVVVYCVKKYRNKCTNCRRKTPSSPSSRGDLPLEEFSGATSSSPSSPGEIPPQDDSTATDPLLPSNADPPEEGERGQVTSPNPESIPRGIEYDVLQGSGVPESTVLLRSGEPESTDITEMVQVHEETVASASSQTQSASEDGSLHRINHSELGRFLSRELLKNESEIKPSLRTMILKSGHSSPDVIINTAWQNNPRDVKESIYESVVSWCETVPKQSEIPTFVYDSLCEHGYRRSAESFKKKFVKCFSKDVDESVVKCE